MRIFIVGIQGKMGKALIDAADKCGDEIVGGLDIAADPQNHIFATATDANVSAEVVIDFSRPATLGQTIALCRELACPCVLGTTGYTAKDEEKIAELARTHAVFRSANMSLGINAMLLLAEKAAAILREYDIEIIERHHNQKADAPSGTAKLLCDAVERGLERTPAHCYGREGNCPRRKGEIGIHAVRGGTIVGEHEVAFCGNDEVVTLHHSAASRKIFADGALRAAHWIAEQSPGLYAMRDMIKIE